MITIICNSCGKAVELPITLDRYVEWKRSGEFVQRAFPELTAGQREMLISKTCDDCWKELFPPEDEEDNDWED